MSADVSAGDLYRHRGNLGTRDIAGETVVVPVGANLTDLQQAFSLNATGAFVWHRLDGRTSLEQIREDLCRSFRVRRREAWRDLTELVEALLQAGLIERAA